MSGKIIEISCASGHLDSLISSAEHNAGTVLSYAHVGTDNQRVSLRLYCKERHVQETIDELQQLLPAESKALLLLSSIDAQIGGADQDSPKSSDKERKKITATREELYREISKGTELNFNFLLLVVLSTLVTSIGLAEDNVAVVIGAMVIAPLLGPNLGLALGAALGDKPLIKVALVTNAVGVSLTVGFALLLALVWAPNLHSEELLARTVVSPSSILLAFAAGIAAVQSLTTRLANLLVGVMIAVALVPPATVFGMMVGVGQWQLASGAGLLLAVNIAAVNLSAQIVFLVRGIRPRTWLERKEAKEATWINTAAWIVLLAVCATAVMFYWTK